MGDEIKTLHGLLRVLAPREIDEVLDAQHTGHLGCYHRHELYVVPITYAREGDFIYSHSHVGKKIEMMRHSPEVCFQVEQISSLFRWRSVILHGRFEELNADEAARGMRILMKKVTGLEDPAKLSQLRIDVESLLSRAIIYRIRITRSSGRAQGL